MVSTPDKVVTIRLEAQDHVTKVLRQAAASADDLAAAAAKVTAQNARINNPAVGRAGAAYGQAAAAAGLLAKNSAKAGSAATAANTTAARAAERLADQQRNAAEASHSLAAGFGAAVGTMAGGLVGGAISTALANVTGQIIAAKDAARDLQEAQQKSGVVFGSNAADMEKWASTSVNAFGLSKRAAVESAASYGDMFTQMGFVGGQAAQMSKEMVQYAADLGAMNNVDTADVLERISAGFRGEYDSLQSLIPAVNAARVEQEAMRMTGEKSASSLTAQQKALALISILHKDGAKSAGYWADNLNSAAEQEQAAAANAENLSAQFGQSLLPAWTAILSSFNQATPVMSGLVTALGNTVTASVNVASNFGKIPGPLQASLAAMVAFRLAQGPLSSLAGTIAGRLTPSISAYREAVMYAGMASQRAQAQAVAAGATAGSLSTRWAGAAAGVKTFTGASSLGQAAMGGLKSAAGGLLGVLGGPWGIAIGGATALIGLFVQKQQEAQAATQQFASGIQSDMGKIGETTQKALADQMVVDGYSSKLRQAGIDTGVFTQAVMGNKAAQDQMNKVFADAQVKVNSTSTGVRGMTQVHDENAQAVLNLKKRYEELKGQFGDAWAQTEEGKRLMEDMERAQSGAGNAAEKAGGQVGKSAQEIDKQREAAEKAKTQTEQYKTALANLANEIEGQHNSERGYQQALDDADESLKKNKRTLDEHTQAGRDNGAALDAIATKGAAAVSTVWSKSNDIAKTAEKMRAVRAEFVQHAKDFGATPEEAERRANEIGLTTQKVIELGAQYNKLPPNVSTVVEFQNWLDTQKKLKEFREGLDIKPTVLQAPVVGEFVRGMSAVQAINDKIAKANPTPTVGVKGADETTNKMAKANKEADKLDKKRPVVKASETGTDAVTRKQQKATQTAEKLGHQRPKVITSESGTDTTRRKVEYATGALEKLDRQRPRPNVVVTGTEQGRQKVTGLLDQLKALVVRPWNAVVNALTGSSNANGAVYPTVRTFANGGMEHHIAQIAPAGSWRIWGEPETGGEAYIPLHRSKRRRSLAILEEVAQRFGMSLVKFAQGGVTQYADGGMRGGSVTVTGTAMMMTAGQVTIPVKAKVTSVIVPRNLTLPFMATPGGKWDRSYTRQTVNTSAISKRFNDLYVSKEELLEFARKNYEAKQALAEANTRAEKAAVSAANKQDSLDARVAAAEASEERLLKRKKPATAKEKKAAHQRVVAARNARASAQPSADASQETYRAGGMSASTSASGARAAGRKAGAAAARNTKEYVKGTKEEVKKRVTPTEARAAALANALSMNGRGSYVYGGGHTSTYYKNSAALAADCSGFVGWAIGHAIGRNVTGTAYSMLRGGSNGFVRIDPKIAAKTAGAIMGNAHHVVMSLGDGRVIESYSKGKPVRIRKLRSSDYKMAAWNTYLGKPGEAGIGDLGIMGGAGGMSAQDLKERQNAAKQAEKEYQAALKAYNTPAYVHLAKATKQQNTFSRKFLNDIKKIRDRGYPSLAYQLMQMGDEDGAVMAASLATAPDKVLRQQRQAFDQNAKLAKEQQQLTEELGKVSGPPAYMVARTESKNATGRVVQFNRDVQKIAAYDPELARYLASLGVDEGFDLAHTIAALPAKDTKQRNAIRNDLITKPRQANVDLAVTNKKYDNAKWTKFLSNIDTLRRRGFLTLADTFLQMGVDGGYDLAEVAAKSSDYQLRGMRRQFVDDPKKLGEKQTKLEEDVLGPVWKRSADATRKKMGTSAAFRDALLTLKKNGFQALALHYWEMGEDAAGQEAISMAKAKVDEQRAMQDLYAKQDKAEKEMSDLGDLLKGAGKTIELAVGIASAADPMVRFTAPRAVDARPPQASAGRYYGGPGIDAPRGPLVNVETMIAANPAEAGTALETRLGDAVAVSGLNGW